ncbi:MAG: hypothetical protein PHY31_06855 [Smithellaceae bacterium]|nr:hypothetical protein [Smithellaceae bacterium]
MATLDLTNEEEKELLQILEKDYLALRIEIVNTDDREFRRSLKQRETIMKSIIDKMRGPGA